MAQLATTCSGYTTLPADISDNIGPISSFSLLVHKDSNEQAISAEAVYYIYGFGPEQYQVAPGRFPRPSAAAPPRRQRVSCSPSRGYPAQSRPLRQQPRARPIRTTTGSKGSNDVNTNGNMVKFVGAAAQAGNAQATLGFASTETVDASRKDVKSLAFQAAVRNTPTGRTRISRSARQDQRARRPLLAVESAPLLRQVGRTSGARSPTPNVQRWIELHHPRRRCRTTSPSSISRPTWATSRTAP